MLGCVFIDNNVIPRTFPRGLSSSRSVRETARIRPTYSMPFWPVQFQECSQVCGGAVIYRMVAVSRTHGNDIHLIMKWERDGNHSHPRPLKGKARLMCWLRSCCRISKICPDVSRLKRTVQSVRFIEGLPHTSTGPAPLLSSRIVAGWDTATKKKFPMSSHAWGRQDP